MADHIDTRDGWREVRADEDESIGCLVEYDNSRHIIRKWVREVPVPVPALPTEQFSVIRVAWKHGARGQLSRAGGLVLRSAGWVDVRGKWIAPRDLAERITGFEVLAEPTPRVALYQEQERVTRDVTERVRRETAKAVLDEVRDTVGAHMDYIDPAVLKEVADEFGVTS